LKRMNTKLARMEEQGDLFKAESFQVEVISNDITTPALKTQLSNMSATPRYFEKGGGYEPGEAVGILIADEFSNTAGKAAFGTDQLIPFLTEIAYNSETYIRQTNADGKLPIQNLAVSVLACTQPGWMRNTIVSDALAGGFTDRSSFIYRGASKTAISLFRIPPLDPLVAEELTDFLVKVAYKPCTPQRLEPTKKAEQFFHDWYTKDHATGPRDAADDSLQTLHRLQIHLNWVAGLLAISEQDSIPFIRRRHYQQALQILNFEESYYQEFISQASESSIAMKGRQILGWIAKQGGCVSKGRLSSNDPFKGWGVKIRGQVLDNLVDTGQLIQGSAGAKTWYRLPNVEWSGESGVG